MDLGLDQVTERFALGELDGPGLTLNASPRPLPPAKARRSASHTRLNSAPVHSAAPFDWRSPPPYAPADANTHPALPTLLGSPISATAQIMSDHRSPVGEAWDHEKSREELEDLLKRADTIIKEREQELDITSVTVRSLAENNAALKSKNNALIACLPPSQPTSPLSSPVLTLSPSHSRNSSRSLLWSPDLTPLRRRTHGRRVPSTPAELAALADQNAELLDKLHDLEADAARADQAAKRRLKGIERELQGIKDELDKTRAMGERLEETLQAAPSPTGLPNGLDEQLVKRWKKLNREAKVRELKAKTRPWDQTDATFDEPKDFAPSSSIFSPQRAQRMSAQIMSPEAVCGTSSNIIERSAETESPLSALSPVTLSTFSSSPREQALISQLLLKVRELEEANAQLAAQHLESRLKLRHAEQEMEGARRLCDFINDEVHVGAELELGDDEPADDDVDHEALDSVPIALGISPRKVARLRPVNRKTSLDFGAAARVRNAGKLRRFNSVDNLTFSQVQRTGEGEDVSIIRHPLRGTRRSQVAGLFEEGSSIGSTSSLRRRSTMNSRDSPLPSVRDAVYDDLGEMQRGPSDSPPPLGCSSSGGSFDASVHDGSDYHRMQSLGSELGLDLSLGHPAPPVHSRSKSIADLLSAIEGEAGLPSQSGYPSSSPPNRPSVTVLRSPPAAEAGAGVDAGSFSLDERLTFPILRRAQGSFTVRSPVHGTDSESGNLDESAGNSTWSLDDSASVLFPRGRSDTDSPFTQDILTLEPSGQQSVRKADQKDRNRNRYAALLVELWLWMQFAVVIVVFVCAMARMGPKSLFRPAPTPAQMGKSRR
ncbi:hypothetical protein M0805_007307 [Coniferiporia weirii]|nr:hypothetical protein M0805_007307 [Coniferiporia weirii]